ICAEDCRQSHDGESLQPIAETMRKLDPTLAATDFYLAVACTYRQRADEALPLFKAALAKEKDPGRRQNYVAWFMPAIAPTGKALAAYAAVPDARTAFRL